MIDPPLTGQPLFDPSELMTKLHAKRRAESLSLQAMAEQTGVSVPTLSRVLRGHVPERENLLRLARWVGLTLGPTHQRRNATVHAADVSTIEAVELHLRADRKLSGQDADALADLFKIAYDRLRRDRADET